jgi:cytochrome d ubiquinol oxidase subunit II
MDEPELQNDFRWRALWSGAFLVPIAFAIFVTSKQGALAMYHGLTQWWAPLLIGATVCFAIAALSSLWLRRFAIARIAAIGEVTFILGGWSLSNIQDSSRPTSPSLTPPPRPSRSGC